MLQSRMAAVGIRIWHVLVVLSLIVLQINQAGSVSVSYDQRALKLDGQRRMLISGSIHYPRSTPMVSEFPRHSSKCINQGSMRRDSLGSVLSI